MALAVLFAPGARPAQAQAAFAGWSATLTPGNLGGGSSGCFHSALFCSSTTYLSDNDFSYGGADYAISQLYLDSSAVLRLTLDRAIPNSLKTSALTLNVDGTALPLADATLVTGLQTNDRLIWTSTGLSWSAGDTVQLSLTDVSANANLGGLTATGAIGASATYRPLALSPAFSADTAAYTATVPYSVTHARLTPTVEETGKATVTVAGVAVTSATASSAVALDVGANAITVRVTAEDGSTTQDYTVTITRQDNHWSSTLTVKDLDFGFGCGYRRGQPQCDDALSNDVVTYDGVDYTVELVHVAYAGGTLQFILDQEPPGTLKQGLRLNVGDRQFTLTDDNLLVSRGIADDLDGDGRNEWTNTAAWVLSWTGTGLEWSEGDSVSLSLDTPVGGL